MRYETLICLGLLTLISAAVFGPHVFRGGFYSDDWANAATYAFSPEPRLTHAIETIQDPLGARPLLAVALAIPQAVLGDHPSRHIALALVLGVLACACFYALLRELGVESVHAGVIVILALLFPWADSTKLWPTAGINEVAVILFLCGLLVALRALQRRGRRAAWMHAAALVLYVASVFTYEIAGAAILLAGALYLTRAPRALALRLWALDATVTVAALAASLALTIGVRPVGSIPGRIRDTAVFARDLAAIFTSSVLPGVPRPVGAGLLAVFAAFVLSRLRAVPPASRASALRWLIRAGVALAGVGAAAVMIAGSGLFPGSEGGANRGNILIALPFAAMLWSLAMAAAQVLFAGSRARVRPAVLTAVLAVIVTGYVARAYDDQQDWQRAHDIASRSLAAVKSHVPRPAPHTTLYMFGVPSRVAEHIPVFEANWDLNGAVKLMWDDGTLHGYPVFDGVEVVCAPRAVYPSKADEFGTSEASSYGRALFVDGRTGRWRPVADRADCLAALREFTPGPETAS